MSTEQSEGWLEKEQWYVKSEPNPAFLGDPDIVKYKRREGHMSKCNC